MKTLGEVNLNNKHKDANFVVKKKKKKGHPNLRLTTDGVLPGVYGSPVSGCVRNGKKSSCLERITCAVFWRRLSFVSCGDRK